MAPPGGRRDWWRRDSGARHARLAFAPPSCVERSNTDRIMTDDLRADDDFDIVAESFIDLAGALGV